MPSSRALHRLATRPRDYMRFLTTGQMPEGVRPEGPLVDLLRALAPRDLSQLVGVTIDSRLGYTGSRRFHYGAQALRWVAPAIEVFDSFPAESWRIKRFQGRLYLEDLAACCSQFPQSLYGRYRSLCRPKPRVVPPAQPLASPEAAD